MYRSGDFFLKKCSKLPGYSPCYSSYSLKSVREYPKIAVCGTNYPNVDGGYRLVEVVFQHYGEPVSGTLTFCRVSESTPEVQNVRQTAQVGGLLQHVSTVVLRYGNPSSGVDVEVCETQVICSY